MGPSKHIVLGFLVLLLLVMTVLNSCGCDIMRAKNGLKDFSTLIERGKLSEISLTIYYMNPNVFTGRPLKAEDLVYALHDDRIEIDGTRLSEHIDLLSRLSPDTIIPVEQKSRIDARVYYIFEDHKGHKIFDVAMWGDDSIFVNGVEAKGNDIFYYVIIPFLPEDQAKQFESYITYIMNTAR